MRRILALIVLIAVFTVAFSVPAWAGGPSSPPKAFGEYNSWLAQKMINDYGLPYGSTWVAPIMWNIWGGHGSSSFDNGGEYIDYMKDAASYE